MRDRIAFGKLPAASVTEKRAQNVSDLRPRSVFQRQRCQPRFDRYSFDLSQLMVAPHWHNPRLHVALVCSRS
jgi:hypothetical protein